MQSLKLGLSLLAIYGGILFGMSLTSTLTLGYFGREQARLFGLSVICVLFGMLVLRILHRRGFMKKGRW